MDEYGLRIPAQSDEWRKSPSRKKDTRKWCKGHVGREHKPEIVLQKWPYVSRGRACHPVPAPDPERSNNLRYSFNFDRDKHGYVCFHEVVCSACSKRLAWHPERCPLNTLP